MTKGTTCPGAWIARQLVGLLWLVFFVVAPVKGVTPDTRECEGWRANSVGLNGAWEFAVGDGSEQAENPNEATRLHWKAVRLPGPFLLYSQEAANETKVIWARRNFKVTPVQARSLGVLHWNRITCSRLSFSAPCRGIGAAHGIRTACGIEHYLTTRVLWAPCPSVWRGVHFNASSDPMSSQNDPCFLDERKTCTHGPILRGKTVARELVVSAVAQQCSTPFLPHHE